jgi:hypothetical protein
MPCKQETRSQTLRVRVGVMSALLILGCQSAKAQGGVDYVAKGVAVSLPTKFAALEAFAMRLASLEVPLLDVPNFTDEQRDAIEALETRSRLLIQPAISEIRRTYRAHSMDIEAGSFLQMQPRIDAARIAIDSVIARQLVEARALLTEPQARHFDENLRRAARDLDACEGRRAEWPYGVWNANLDATVIDPRWFPPCTVVQRELRHQSPAKSATVH